MTTAAAARRVLHVDFETCNTLDLRAVGADVYSRSPDLVVTVCAWAFDDDPVQSATIVKVLPPEVESHLRQARPFVAWNAAFEADIIENHFLIPLVPGQADCAMQRALHAGLPAALGDAGPALGLSIVKDKSANLLMRQMMKPRSPGRWWHHDSQAKLAALEAYCRRDVEAERAIVKMIPELPDGERRVSQLDAKANALGVQIDLPLVQALKALAENEILRLNREAALITQGEVTDIASQVGKTMAWLASQGEPLSDLGKASVSSALTRKTLPGHIKRLLEIRRDVAKTSVKKLNAMIRCSSFDGRVRGQLAYYGAGRTGRWAGRLVQPQNFPRGGLRKPQECASWVKRGLDSEGLRLGFSEPLDAISACLRACLVPGPGKTFVAYDFSQIEARVLAWLAGQQDVLDACRRGEDIYIFTMHQVGLPDRQGGKIARLALGYGMGASKLMDTAMKQYGVRMDAASAQDMVDAFRSTNKDIVALWRKVEKVARQALDDFLRAWAAAGPGRTTRLEPVHAKVNAKLSFTASEALNGSTLLTMRLPSGRRLYYRNARIEGGEIFYDGVAALSHKWTAIKTYGAKLVENAVQAISRDIMADAALRIDGDTMAGGKLVLTVHDEIILEVDDIGRSTAALAAMIKQEVERVPPWAKGLPIASDGGVRSSYAKG